MAIPPPKPKWLCNKPLYSSGKIKIHQRCFVITPLANAWLTIRRVRFQHPNPTTKRKSLSLANNVPAGCMNQRSLWGSYFSPLTPLHFHHRHSSPKLHPCSVLLVGPHDKLLLGLLSKISTCQREWLGRGGRGRGVRQGFKACWGSADKGEGQISPAADKQKEFILITNGCCLKATKSTAKVTRSCVFTCLQCFHFLHWFLVQKNV